MFGRLSRNFWEYHDYDDSRKWLAIYVQLESMQPAHSDNPIITGGPEDRQVLPALSAVEPLSDEENELRRQRWLRLRDST